MLRISVVVPAAHDSDRLERTLRALDRQAFPASDYEVIVADAAASSATRAIVHRAAADSAVAMRYVPVLVRRSPAAARNVGWRQAHGEVVAFTDSETIPHAGWLRGFSDAAERGADAGWGVLIVPTSDPPTEQERDQQALEHAGFVAANVFCRRDVLDDLGGFDERYRDGWCDDSDLFFRLVESGRRVEHIPESLVVRPARVAAWGSALRRERRHQWDVLLHKEHPVLYRRYVRRDRPYLPSAIAGALAFGAVGVLTRRRRIATAGGAAWVALTATLVARRLRGTSHTLPQVAEIAATSLVLPPLALFWRVVGGVRHRHLVW